MHCGRNNLFPMSSALRTTLLCVVACCTAQIPLVAQCGSTVYDTGGAGGNYGANENYTWTYCAPPGQVVTLNFTAFNTEAGYDELSIHDGANNLAPMLGIFDGTGLPPSISGTVPGGCLTLWFTSDGSFNYGGWAISISCAPVVPPAPACGSTVYDSGGAGGNYGNNSNTFTTYCPSTPGDVVTIDFSLFDTEANYDILTIYNGPNAGSPSLGSYSGMGFPGPFTSTDPSGCLTIGFSSDASFAYAGWVATISCAPPVPPPSGDCVYALNLFDSFGDGWGSSSVGVSINGGPFTYYSLTGASRQVLIGVNIGQTIVLAYNNTGPYQYENSYSLGLSGGGQYFQSGASPAPGISFTQTINCQAPPAAPQDCAGGATICSGQAFNNNSANTGNVVDLSAANAGCLLSGERQGTWYYFSPSASGTIGFTIAPTVVTDYDFAVWGPMTSVSCPPSGPPLRCSYAAPDGNTGAGNGAVDNSEDAYGDRWVTAIPAIAGQVFLLYIDNFSSNGQAFDLSWQLSNGASLDCTALAVGEINLQAQPKMDHVDLQWSTTTERESDHFVVQRSTDAVSFEDVGRLPAAGQSSTTITYSLQDHTAKGGMNYYRILAVGQTGSRQYSPVASALLTGTTGMLVVPNPVTASATLFLDNAVLGQITLRTMDASGRIVSERVVVENAGSNRLEFPVSALEPGSYFVQVIDANGEVVGRVPFIRQ